MEPGDAGPTRPQSIILNQKIETILPIIGAMITSGFIKIYGKFLGIDVIEEKNCIKYQLFKNIKAKEKYDDDNYMGLTHDFFQMI